jgi:hypothetical protein
MATGQKHRMRSVWFCLSALRGGAVAVWGRPLVRSPVPPHGVSCGRPACIAWPGRDRGGAQVAGAGAAVAPARFWSFVRASLWRYALTWHPVPGMMIMHSRSGTQA